MAPNRRHPPPKRKRSLPLPKPPITATVQQERGLTQSSSITPAPGTPATVTPVLVAPPPQKPSTTPRPFRPNLSLFLTLLPLELRQLVYHFVFASHELQIFLPCWYFMDNHARTHGARQFQVASACRGGKWQAGWWGRVITVYPKDSQYLKSKQVDRAPAKLLGLVLCCRQVYMESIRFLYASPGFTVFHSLPLIQFVDDRGADFLCWVRELRVEYKFTKPIVSGWVVVPAGKTWRSRDDIDWDGTCRCLEKMTGLRVLHVTIYPSDALMKEHCMNDMLWNLLEMLWMVRADEFRVWTRKPFMKFREMAKEAPFELCEIHEDN